MNINAPSFAPQGTGNDKPAGNSSNFRSSLTGSSNQRALPPLNHSKTFSSEPQRSTPNRGKNQRQSNSKRNGYEREQGQSRAGSNNKPSTSSSSLSSTMSSAADSLATSMSQLSANDKAGGRGNNKKNQVSLNHLLNFSFPVREEPQNVAPIRRRRNANYQPFDKDKFINANFRFLMHPRSDYAVFTMDADVRVQWEDIEQVLIAVPQSCPICLQPPVAARVTKCGHVYCFSCILHYLALSDTNKAWRKCPICWDAIYEKDLKSVRTTQDEHDIYDQGEKEIAKKIAAKQEVHVEMKLIQRSLNSTVALPRSNTFPLGTGVLSEELQGQPPLEFYPDAMLFSRLMITTVDRITSELDRDIRSIECAMEEAKSYDVNSHSEEIVFFEMAMTKIQERKEKVKDDAKFLPKVALEREKVLRDHFDHAASIVTPEIELEPESAAENARPLVTYNETGPEAYELSRKLDTPVSTPVPEDSTAAQQSGSEKESSDAAKTNKAKTKTPNQLTTMYFFYQASNGHHLYLQPLDIRILKQHFETYDCFPDTITVKVLGIEETSLTEEVRKKCKYLGHLPLGCEVSFLDVALEDVVGADGVKPFEAELRLRRTKRREKEAKEERERLEREHKLNPPKPKRDEFFMNDPFFQAPAGHNSNSSGPRRTSDAELQEALRLSTQSALEEMPTLIEANALLGRRTSIPSSASTSASRTIPGTASSDNGASGSSQQQDLWGSSYESSNGSHTGPSTVWGTPSVPISRHHDDYDDYYDDEHDYEPDVVVKRGKKKVTVLMSNNSRRSR
ncbi:hypothetical protein BGZ83_011312 [Gryganskiella cystojenkinii]|nr:hypothetical protein BGZ83_011312 [Gryganskiella cystojenkinii]